MTFGRGRMASLLNGRIKLKTFKGWTRLMMTASTASPDSCKLQCGARRRCELDARALREHLQGANQWSPALAKLANDVPHHVIVHI